MEGLNSNSAKVIVGDLMAALTSLAKPKFLFQLCGIPFVHSTRKLNHFQGDQISVKPMDWSLHPYCKTVPAAHTKISPAQSPSSSSSPYRL